jgi:hypothetical protein
MLGALMLVGGLLGGAGLLAVLGRYPEAVLNVLLLLAGLELARTIRGVLDQPRQLFLGLLTAAVSLGVNVGAGFLAGLVVAAGLALGGRWQRAPDG